MLYKNPTHSPMNDPKIFWQWFQDHSEQLMLIDDMPPEASQKLLLELDKQLTQFSAGASFEIGDLTPQGRTFLLTAEGDTDYFPDIQALYDSAPETDWWNIEAFRPAKGAHTYIIYEGVRYDSRNYYFVPMENTENPEQIGIMVGVKHHNPKDENQLFGIFTLIESMLGEYDCGTLLGFLDTTPLPNDPENSDFIPLEKLPDFVAWHLDKQSKE